MEECISCGELTGNRKNGMPICPECVENKKLEDNFETDRNQGNTETRDSY